MSILLKNSEIFDDLKNGKIRQNNGVGSGVSEPIHAAAQVDLRFGVPRCRLACNAR